MKPLDKKPMETHTPAYTTFPLAQTEYREKESNESIPSEGMVSEAKEWVDHNEK